MKRNHQKTDINGPGESVATVITNKMYVLSPNVCSIFSYQYILTYILGENEQKKSDPLGSINTLVKMKRPEKPLFGQKVVKK